jgi:DNA-binding FadR family transcriptional regulator
MRELSGTEPSSEGGKLSDRVYAALFREIAEGHLRKGERLPAEAMLAERFGVSRAIVREALAQLRGDGVIVSQRGSGSYVARQPERAILEFPPVEDIAELARCLEFRLAVEGEAAFLAAQRRTEAALTALRQAGAAFAASIATQADSSEADYLFHLAVAEAAANDWFADTMRMMQEQVRVGMELARSLSRRRQHERSQIIPSEHAAIIEAIARHAPEEARRTMRAHIEFARTRILGERA